MPATRSTKSTKPAGPPPTGDYIYTAPNGKEITLPPMHKALNASELRKLRKSSQLEIVFYIIERDNPADEDGKTPALDALDEALESMSMDKDIPELIEEWQAFSRLSLGESSAS